MVVNAEGAKAMGPVELFCTVGEREVVRCVC